MDAIYFIYHRGLTDPVTRKHLALVRAMNPDDEVIPLSFPSHSPDSYHWQTANHDLLMFDYFDTHHPKHEHHWLIEWDTFCTQSFREFAGESYHKKVIGSQIVYPWSDEIMETNMDGFNIRQRDWHWFSENKSPELHPYLRGIVPASVVMMSHDALFGMNQLLRTVPAFKHLSCEARLGTLACMAGFEPQSIRTDCQKFVSSRDVDIGQGKGCFHRCRA